MFSFSLMNHTSPHANTNPFTPLFRSLVLTILCFLGTSNLFSFPLRPTFAAKTILFTMNCLCIPTLPIAPLSIFYRMDAFFPLKTFAGLIQSLAKLILLLSTILEKLFLSLVLNLNTTSFALNVALGLGLPLTTSFPFLGMTISILLMMLTILSFLLSNLSSILSFSFLTACDVLKLFTSSLLASYMNAPPRSLIAILLFKVSLDAPPVIILSLPPFSLSLHYFKYFFFSK